MGYLYDFHIHTCLSPCGEEEMTPYNIVTFAKLLDLSIIAITDHNNTGNCASAMKAGKEQGLVVVPGMEVTTSEEIDMICLFPTLDTAQDCSRIIYSRLPDIKNKAEIFGRQLFMDSTDNIIGEEERLLINATSISFDNLPRIVAEYGGVCYPAHIDKSSSSVLSVLGMLDESMNLSHYEITHTRDLTSLKDSNPLLKGMRKMYSSDSHWLEQMAVSQYEGITLKELSPKGVIDWFVDTGYKML